LTNGKTLKEVVVEYPIGHKRRRKDGIPLLLKKFERNLKRILPEKKQKLILKLCNNQNTFENTDVNVLVDHLSLS
jgi:2-methylcitrate dehydratase